MSLPYSNVASLPIGSITVTIGAAAYRAVNWNYALNSREIRRNNNLGDRAEFQLRSEPTTGTVTFQLATTSTAVPGQGVVFTADGIGFVITTVTPNKPEGEFHTVDIGFTTAV